MDSWKMLPITAYLLLLTQIIKCPLNKKSSNHLHWLHVRLWTSLEVRLGLQISFCVVTLPLSVQAMRACCSRAWCCCRTYLRWRWSGAERRVSSPGGPSSAWLCSAAGGEGRGWRRTRCTSTTPPQSTPTPGTAPWRSCSQVTHTVWKSVVMMVGSFWFLSKWSKTTHWTTKH